MNIKEFGQQIKEIRNQKKLTLEQLGNKTGYTKGYISQIENGKLTTIPQPETLKKISKGLNVDYEFLMYLAGYLDRDTYEKSTSLKKEIQEFEEIISRRTMEKDVYSNRIHALEKKMNELENIASNPAINEEKLLEALDKLRLEYLVLETERHRNNEELKRLTKEYEETINLYKTLDKTSDKSKKREIEQMIFDKEKLLQFIESSLPEVNYELPEFKSEITNEDEFLLSLFKVNEDAFINDIPTPVFVDENNNINIEIHKGCSYLNDKDTEELNSMIKGFLYNKKFLPYDE